MAINARGFWRVLAVLYVVYAVGAIGIAISVEVEAWTCRKEQPAAVAAHDRLEQLPSCGYSSHCENGQVVSEPWMTTCLAPASALGYGAVALLVGAIVLWGSGFLIRWVYRGFTASG